MNGVHELELLRYSIDVSARPHHRLSQGSRCSVHVVQAHALDLKLNGDNGNVFRSLIEDGRLEQGWDCWDAPSMRLLDHVSLTTSNGAKTRGSVVSGCSLGSI
jgi:hypothetical protein